MYSTTFCELNTIDAFSIGMLIIYLACFSVMPKHSISLHIALFSSSLIRMIFKTPSIFMSFIADKVLTMESMYSQDNDCISIISLPSALQTIEGLTYRFIFFVFICGILDIERSIRQATIPSGIVLFRRHRHVLVGLLHGIVQSNSHQFQTVGFRPRQYLL